MSIEAPAPPAPAKFGIGLDIGTTHTAASVSYDGKTTTFNNSDGEPEPNRTNNEVPTIVACLIKNARLIKSANAYNYRIRYGYEVTPLRTGNELPEIVALYDPCSFVSMFKFLLDDSEPEHFRSTKEKLRLQLEELKKTGHIKKDTDVIRDFLTCILQHIKKQLVINHGYQDGDTGNIQYPRRQPTPLKGESVEVRLSVPVCWNSNANAAIRSALEAAMQSVQLGTDGKSMCCIFVSEPEAQSILALDESSYNLQVSRTGHDLLHITDTVKTNEIFILVDCGGGTTDIIIFRIGHARPLHLSNQILDAVSK